MKKGSLPKSRNLDEDEEELSSKTEIQNQGKESEKTGKGTGSKRGRKRGRVQNQPLVRKLVPKRCGNLLSPYEYFEAQKSISMSFNCFKNNCQHTANLFYTRQFVIRL